ncbi:MAG: cell division cycle 123 family protein [Lentisphaeraceae bacterium]|nr:cell division cycle 123 family protein [Lentisphaeraceae bacterium]
MQGISDWYISLGDFTFPTVFAKLSEAEKQIFVSDSASADTVSNLSKRIDRAITALPGACFIGLNTCAPDDAPVFQRKKSHSSGKTAIDLLKNSQKVKSALNDSTDDTLAIRPYRRMDKTREFRLFVFKGKLSGMSQRNLIRHFRRLDSKREEYWDRAQAFFNEISALVEFENIVIDIYFTSDGSVLIVDMNEWEKCDPLLFRKWDRDWSETAGLKLMSEPIKMNGDVKVSF